MRTELEEMDLIERYHRGELTGEELKAFNARLAEDGAFQFEVETQGELMRFFEHQGLKAEIEAAHERNVGEGLSSDFRIKGKWWMNIKLWIVAAVMVVGATVAWWAIPTEHGMESSQREVVQPSTDEAAATFNAKQTSITHEPARYEIDATEGGRVVDSRSGAVITVPPNALVHTDGSPVKGKVELTYTEFRDHADMAVAGIPMTVEKDGEEMRMNSAGMFEIRAHQEEEAVHVKQGEEVEVLFHMCDSIPETSFWKLDEETQEWQELRSNVEKEPRVKMAVGEMYDAVADTSYETHIELDTIHTTNGAFVKQLAPKNSDERFVDIQETAAQEEAIVADAVLGVNTNGAPWVLDSRARLDIRKAADLADRVINSRHPNPLSWEANTDMDQTRFDDRYKSLNYSGTRRNRQVLESSGRVIKLALVRGKIGREAHLELQFPRDEYTELKPFKRTVWIYDARDNVEYNVLTEKMLERNWADIRVLQSEEDDQLLILELKHKSGFTFIPVRPFYGKSVTEQVAQKKTNRYMDEYKTALKARQQNFDASLEAGIRESQESWDQEVMNLYDVAALVSDSVELHMDRDEWEQFFLGQPEAQKARYDSLAQLVATRQIDEMQLVQALEETVNAMDIQANGLRYKIGDHVFRTQPMVEETEFPREVIAVEQDLPFRAQVAQPSAGDQNWSDEDSSYADVADRSTSTLLRGGGDAGHTYPPLVRKLNVSDFGVYNCDQLYRLAKQITITPEFVDEWGEPIQGLHVLSLIDLRYRGAFSLNPQNSFQCSKVGRNALLLFTHDGKVYFLSEAAYAEMEITASGRYTFEMADMTSEFQTVDDLRAALEMRLNGA